MNITVYCGSAPGSRESYAKAAQELGSWLAHEGHTLVYGGGKIGLMGIVADAVLACAPPGGRMRALRRCIQ